MNIVLRCAPTLAEIAQKYLAERRHLQHSTLCTYQQALRTHILPRFGDQPWELVDAHELGKFRSELAVKLSGRTTNKVIGLLRDITRWAAARDLCADGLNKAIILESVRQETTEVDPFTTQEVDAVLRCLKPRYRQFFACWAWTGARMSELVALRWKDIDMMNNEIHITKARVKGIEGRTKTPSSKRRIPMFPPVRVAMELQKPYSYSDELNYVFVNENQRPLGKHIDLMWKRACQRAGVRHRPPRQLRHSFASWCLAAGEAPAYIANLLGHASPDTTFRYYARWIPNQRKDGRMLEEAIRSHYGLARGPGGLST